MPALNWIGKDAIVKHLKEVPFRLREPGSDLSCGDSLGQLPGGADQSGPILAVGCKGAQRGAGAEDDESILGLRANLPEGRCRFVEVKVRVKDKRSRWLAENLPHSPVPPN